MMTERALLACLVVGSLVFIMGCGLVTPAPPSQISGSVVNATSGEPVVGSRVRVEGSNTGFSATVTTGGRGRFSIRVPRDRYTLTLSKRGYAASRVVGLDAHAPATIRIIQREVFNSRWATRPPDVELNGVEDGDQFQGAIPYHIEASSENDIRYIYVAVGKTPGASFLTAPRKIFQETPSTGAQALDPGPFGVRGPTTFETVVYDFNGNRTHLIRHITVVPPEGLVSAPRDLRAVAVTLGKQIGFFGMNGAGMRDPRSAPFDANVYVELDWNASSTENLTGYKVYRSFDRETFQEIATVHGQQTDYKDASSELAVGKQVQYRVTAIRGGDESEPSDVAATRPLETFDVQLISPRDGATAVSRIPTFRWQPTRRVALYHIYGVVLWDTVLGESAFWVTPEPPEFVINRTSYRWNENGRMKGTPWETLQPQRLYEWEVPYAVAVDSLENPTSVSVAINRFSLEDERLPIDAIFVPASENFTFTTGE